MRVYMIGYDLHPLSAEDYDKLYTALKGVGSGYWDCLELDVAGYNGKDPRPK